MSTHKAWGSSSPTRASAALALAALAACGVIGLLGAGDAVAGTYTIGDCPDAFNQARTAGPWQFFGPSSGATIHPQCSDGAHDSIWTDIVELPTEVMGFRASTDGTHLAIVNARLWWHAFGSPGGEVEAELDATNGAGEYLAISSWEGSGALVEQITTPEERSFAASEDATSIWVGVHCLAASQCQMTESWGVGVQIFGAELTLSDEVPPTVAITAVQDEGGASVSGPVQTTFTAADPDAGVRKAELLLDGVPVVTHDYSSSCSYTQLQACPGTISERLEFTGASVPEGAHQLAVRVTDAAGNTTVTPSQTLSTAHHVPNGVPCPSPTITLTADRRASQVTIPFGHGAIVEGRLGCGHTPVPGASIVLGISMIAGAPAASSVPVPTAPDGTFRYELAPGPSRRLAFSYRAYSNEPAPAAQSTLQVNVTPKITLHISPRRTHDNATITWRGRIEGGPYPAGGMPLLAQVKEGKRWQTFDEIVVHNGKIGYRYTFRRTSKPTTYSFRVALPSGGAVNYDYAAPAASRKVEVHVR